MEADFFEILQQPYFLRAITAAALVGITSAVLGSFVMLRNMALVGDALSHAVLPGVVLGYILAGYSLTAFFWGAVAAGLLTAVVVTYLQRNVYVKNDAAIGIVFTAMFALGVIGISILSRGQGVHLDIRDFLFGNVLGITPQDLNLTGVIAGFVLLSIVVFYRPLHLSTFSPVVAKSMGLPTGALHYYLMLLLALAVVAALQSVGVILVVAMLIVPASTAYLLTDRLHVLLVLAAVVGVLSAMGGMLLAVALNLPPGPAMTLCGVALYALAVLFAPKRGLVRRWAGQRAAAG